MTVSLARDLQRNSGVPTRNLWTQSRGSSRGNLRAARNDRRSLTKHCLRALCGEAAALLPPEPWDGLTWDRWAADVKRATGIKGKALFQPLRLALTGREHGPELKLLLPLIGQSRALARLEGKTA